MAPRIPPTPAAPKTRPTVDAETPSVRIMYNMHTALSALSKKLKKLKSMDAVVSMRITGEANTASTPVASPA